MTRETRLYRIAKWDVDTALEPVYIWHPEWKVHETAAAALRDFFDRIYPALSYEEIVVIATLQKDKILRNLPTKYKGKLRRNNQHKIDAEVKTKTF